MSTTTDIQERANASYRNFADDELRAQLALVRDGGSADDEREEALIELEEQPLAVEKLITDHRNERVEWEILLGTGGPAVRILVHTDERGWAVLDADYQYQDWFQPWTSAEDQDEELVRAYAEVVGRFDLES